MKVAGSRPKLFMFSSIRLSSALICVAVVASGCGAGLQSSNGGSGTPKATITLSLFSNPVPAGSPGFSATANGTGFTPSSAVFWNGTQLTTSYQSSSILYASVPSNLLAEPGGVTLLVKDGSTGTTSNSLSYQVLSPAAGVATVVQLVSIGADGSGANGDSLVLPSISTTGRFVAFQSAGTNLTSQQILTPWQNIYLRDTCIGAASPCSPSTQLISVSSDGTNGGNWHSRASTVSADGRYVAFDSGATNLLPSTPAVCNSSTNCVYLRDTCLGATTPCTPRTVLASIGPGEVEIDGANPVLSASGRYLTFDSNGSPAGQAQTYIRDLCSNVTVGCVPQTALVSVNSLGAPGNEGAQPQSLSADGRFVGFVSYSTNLIDPSQAAVQSTAMMFVRDTCIGAPSPCLAQISRIDVADGGGAANNALDYEAIPSLSSTGRYIAYSSNATNLVSQDVHGFGNVYLRDTCFGATSCTSGNSLVSLGNDGSIANSGSHQQSMSSDGRYVAFTSIATNLVWGIAYSAGTWQDVYVRDTCTGAASSCVPSTVRVAVTNTPIYQTPSDAGASLPAISGDAHYVAFISSSTNLTAANTNGHAQVFLAKTGY